MSKILSQKFLEKKFFKIGVPPNKGQKIPRKISRIASYPLYGTGTGGYIRGVTGVGVRRGVCTGGVILLSWCKDSKIIHKNKHF